MSPLRMSNKKRPSCFPFGKDDERILLNCSRDTTFIRCCLADSTLYGYKHMPVPSRVLCNKKAPHPLKGRRAYNLGRHTCSPCGSRDTTFIRRHFSMPTSADTFVSPPCYGGFRRVLVSFIRRFLLAAKGSYSQLSPYRLSTSRLLSRCTGPVTRPFNAFALCSCS